MITFTALFVVTFIILITSFYLAAEANKTQN